MQAAARISVEIGMCDRDLHERICDAVHAWGHLPTVTLQTSKALRLIQSDKKTESGAVNFVLPRAIGEVDIVKNVPERVISAALDEIRRASRD
jgi:3-dehydroquinate synthase